MKKWIVLMGASLAASLAMTPALAHETHCGESCSIDFASEVAVSDKVIRIRRDGSDLVLTDTDRVFVDYEEVAVSDDQLKQVQAYASGIRETVPEVVTIALEGVQVGLTALSEVAYGMFDAEPPQALLDAIEEINTRVDEHVRYEQGEYFLSGDRISGVEDAMATIEPALEKAISASIGQMFSNLGDIFTGGGDLEVNLTDMTTRMEKLGERVEQRVEKTAGRLEKRAIVLCEKLESLERTEQSLHEALPALERFQLVTRST